MEAGSGIDGDGQREDLLAEVGAARFQAFVEIGMFLVQAVDRDHLRDAVVGGILPDLIGSDADPVAGIDHDEGEITDADGSEALGDEVHIPRGIDDVEFSTRATRYGAGRHGPRSDGPFR